MKELQELEQQGILDNVHLKETYLEAVKRTSDLLTKESIILPSTSDAHPVARWKRGFASSWLWLFVSICFLPGFLRGKTEKAVMFGMLVMGSAVWLIGAAIPPFWWPWFHGGILVAIQFIVVMAYSSRKKKISDT